MSLLRIAIVGAGLAGLSCAHELERLGLTPEIFEKRHRVGERCPNVESMAQFLHIRPHQDIFQYVREELHLPLYPSGTINRMIVYGPSSEAIIRGKLGYLTIRGHDPRSLDCQLARHVKAAIRFNQNPDVYKLSQQYDWVVVATGDQAWTREFLQWTPHVRWWIRGAVVKGDFDPGSLIFFFNPRYAKTGYAMVSPFDECTAAVGVGIPESDADEVDRYWQTFREEQSRFWQKETLQYKLEKFETGTVGRHILGNVVLIGNAGGFVDSLGIAGQCPSMTSGVMAARQITLGDRSLERYARQWRVYYKRNHRLRRHVNSWTDDDINRMVAALRYGGNLVARSPINLLKPAGFFIDALRLADAPSPEAGRN